MEIFGRPDRKDGGKTTPVCSTYPVYFFKEHIEQLKEDVSSLSRRIKYEDIPAQHIATHKEELRVKQEKLDLINESAPKLTTNDKNKLDRFIKEIGSQISDLMPTHTDMEKGLASPQEEVRRMHKEGCVDISGHSGLIKAMGIKPMRNGQITRNAAAKGWQIASSLRGRPTNTETLRKDRVGHSYKIEPTLKQIERDG